LETEQAEASKQVSQAAAESRRAAAVALEQEMKARISEMKAKLVEAESQVPMALADALRHGKLGVMDYYNMKNLVADTEMRGAIAAGGAPTKRGSADSGGEGPTPVAGSELGARPAPG